ncbi:hypothetical protein [Atopobacter phocae]|uniref:RNA polymerase factor sigma-54 n=1 Tax=Atopobacter phocae TaxID=136492 RepID=UPI00047187CA|nr:hypothetical protein [Atopobacter phocae]
MILRVRNKTEQAIVPKSQMVKNAVLLLNYTIDELRQFIQLKSTDNPLIQVEWQDSGISLDAESIPDTPLSEEEDHSILSEQISEDESSQTLISHLLNQVDLYMRETFLRDLVLYMIDYIDRDGYFRMPLEDVERRTGASAIEVLDALTLIQLLDPAGIGARDLQECLELQALNDNEAPIGAYDILHHYYDAFVANDKETIQSELAMSDDDYEKVSAYIRQLDPTPGQQFEHSDEVILSPAVSIKRQDDKLIVRYLDRYIPNVHLDEVYYDELIQSQDEEVIEYVKQQKEDAMLLIEGLKKRQRMIVQVSDAIARSQFKYLMQQSDELAPLYLRDIANETELRLSTVNRIVMNHAVMSDRGIIPLRYLISTSLKEE